MPKEQVIAAFKAITEKQTPYTQLWAYFDGDQPLVYASKRLEEVFADLDAKFSENWCEVVIGASRDRIQLTGFTVKDNPKATDLLSALFAELELGIESDEAHEAALVIGEAFIFVSPDDQTGELEVFYNDPRLCHVQYDSSNPHRPVWAAKLWVDEELKRWRLNIYDAEKIEYWVSSSETQHVQDGNNFVPFEISEGVTEAQHDFGQIPIFHLRPNRRKVKSDLANVITPQNGVNKLLIDMMVAAEFGAFKQRWIISNGDTSTLKNAPNKVWDLAAGDGTGQGTSVGEFSSTDLNNYLSAIDQLARAIAVITRTPKHYFFAQGGEPSGEALIAMESPLVKKCDRYIERFSSTWKCVAAFICQLSGEDVVPSDITPIFADPHSVLPVTQSQVRAQSVQSGMPLKTVLREEGWSEDRIAQMEKDRQEEKSSQQSSLAEQLVNQMRGFNSGSQAPGGPPTPVQESERPQPVPEEA